MKRLLACALICFLLVSIAACGGKTPVPMGPTSPTELPNPQAATTVPSEATTAPQETEPAETQPAVQNPVPLQVLTGNHYMDEWDENYNPLGSVSWQSVILSDDCAAVYPRLAAALRDWNEGESDTAQAQLEDMLPDARAEVAAIGSDFNGYTYTTEVTVQRADSLIFSARCDYDTYIGGPRPFYGTYCLNLNPVTGQSITIDRIFANMGLLPEILRQALVETYSDYPAGSFDGVADILAEYSPESYTWTMTYQGVQFYFGVSELTAGALGALNVTLWFDEYPELFDSSYFRIPEGGYAIALSNTNINEVDLHPDDGMTDLFGVTLLPDRTLRIDRNDESMIEDAFYSFDFDAYLVTLDGENFYLYIDSSGENDYRTMIVYNQTGQYLIFEASYPGAGFRSVWYEENVPEPAWYMPVFNDPSCFVMGTRINLLGTMTGFREYYANPETGCPRATTGYYRIPEDQPPLTSKIPLEVLILPDEATEIIPAGTIFYFLRTDNDSYVDLRMDDGRECRILITYDDWWPLVNGLPEEDCFDGLFYAG